MVPGASFSYEFAVDMCIRDSARGETLVSVRPCLSHVITSSSSHSYGYSTLFLSDTHHRLCVRRGWEREQLQPILRKHATLRVLWRRGIPLPGGSGGHRGRLCGGRHHLCRRAGGLRHVEGRARACAGESSVRTGDGGRYGPRFCKESADIGLTEAGSKRLLSRMDVVHEVMKVGRNAISQTRIS